MTDFSFHFKLHLSDDEDPVPLSSGTVASSCDDLALLPVTQRFLPQCDALDEMESMLFEETQYFAEQGVVSLFKRHASDISLQVLRNYDDTDHSDESDNEFPIPTRPISIPVKDAEAAKARRAAALVSAVTERTDLIPRLYEGGLTTWECTGDLISYLAARPSLLQPHHRIIELGCGSGLPGIYCLLQDQSIKVDFQDYNEQVLEWVTLPNVAVNLVRRPTEQEVKETKNGVMEVALTASHLMDKVLHDRVGFFAGDWSTLPDCLMQDLPDKSITPVYDLVLMSETIYSPSAYPKLTRLLRQLVKPTGLVLVAAKTLYFGPGGGTREFEKAMISNGFVVTDNVRIKTQGVAREIMALRWV